MPSCFARTRSAVRRCVLFAGLAGAVLPPASRADEPPVTPDELSRRIVRQPDGRRIIFITLKNPPPAPTPEPARPVPPPSAEELAAAERRAAKPRLQVSMSVTVHPEAPLVTEFSWQEADRPRRAFSNIDFRLLRNFGEFETERAVYDWGLLWVNEAGEGTPRPALPAGFRTGSADYWLLDATAADSSAAPGILDLLDHLHAHMDVNQAALQAAETARQAAEAAAAEAERARLAAPPAPPPDIVIRRWREAPAAAPAQTPDARR